MSGHVQTFGRSVGKVCLVANMSDEVLRTKRALRVVKGLLLLWSGYGVIMRNYGVCSRVLSLRDVRFIQLTRAGATSDAHHHRVRP